MSTSDFTLAGPARGPGMSLVVFCLVRAQPGGCGAVRFLLLRKGEGMTFPPTKLRPKEDLCTALARPLREDLGLPADSYFPEEELHIIPNGRPGPQ